LTYQIGQFVHSERREPRVTALTGERLFEPLWHILRVASGQEAAKRDRLNLAGVHVCYPTRDVSWRDAQGRTQSRSVADVPGWIFAKFSHAPRWHEMRARRIILGVVCRDTDFGPVPYRATENDVRRWVGIPTVEEELEAERLEALRVRPGDDARVLIGGNLDLAVKVTDVRAGRVFWEIGALKGEASEDRCQRIDVGT